MDNGGRASLVREMNAALTLRNNRQQVRALNIRTARRSS